jgi:hypothetical protein
VIGFSTTIKKITPTATTTKRTTTTTTTKRMNYETPTFAKFGDSLLNPDLCSSLDDLSAN